MSNDPVDAICEVIEDYVGFAMSFPRLYKIMFSKSLLDSPELANEAELTYSRLAKLMKQLSLDVKATSEASTAAWAMLHGISTLILEDLLARNGRGEIQPSLISGGMPLTEEETREQIKTVARIMASGIAASSVNTE